VVWVHECFLDITKHIKLYEVLVSEYLKRMSVTEKNEETNSKKLESSAELLKSHIDLGYIPPEPRTQALLRKMTLPE